MAQPIQNLRLNGVHILVVEDLLPIQDIIRDLLIAMGVGKISIARDGEEGYEMYSQLKPDLIITDWHMPKLNGIELVKKIRVDSDSPDRAVPIIMMTGYCSKQQISLARDSGITEFLAKPFTSDEIAKRIAYIIKNPRDIVITSRFIGPDRRRKTDEPGEEARTGQEPKKIPANLELQKKTGVGVVDPNAIAKSQRVIDNNKIDFVPIAHHFMKDLYESIQIAKQGEEPHQKIIERLTTPIMQIKANAIIFQYDLVGDLAKTALDFLNGLTEINEYVMEIIEALYNTLLHLLEKQMKGDCQETGKSLVDELEGACKRYMSTRSELLKKSLKKKINT